MASSTGDAEDLWASRMSPTHLEALTDGVFAIAMTILVLELSVPHMVGPPVSGQHSTSFLDMRMEFHIVALAYMTIATARGRRRQVKR